MAKPTRSLVDHTDDVVTACLALFGTWEHPTGFARRWLTFFRLSEAQVRPFLRNGLLACLVHDWGKANTGFAGMLAGTAAQTARHEVVSVLIMMQEQVWSWLGSAEKVDLPLVLAAVAGHHLKAADPGTFEDVREFGAIQDRLFGSVFALTWDHPRIREQLASLAERFDIDRTIPGGVARVWAVKPTRAGVASYKDERNRAIRAIRSFHKEIADAPDSDRARMLRAVRSALIAADSAGSALFRTHGETGRPGDVRDHIRRWIGDAFDPSGNLSAEKVHEAVIEPRIEEVTREGWPFSWNEFQLACADPGRVPARALPIAPCGSGKTLAAWRWVAARCRERPVARAIFLYPTRGTATEGFRDYVSHACPGLAALVHGTSELDLEHLQPDLDWESRIAEARLFSLRQWPKRVFSATVDQFLAFLQHDYGSTCLLPLLADSAIVIDEVHSYDRGMFTALTQFLEHFDVPVLAMTATMIERRKADLARYLTPVDGLGFGTDASRLRRIADHPRYAVPRVAGVEGARREVETALGSGLRVLWVVNTVDRAQALARGFAADPRAARLATRAGTTVLSYHSRFRLGDRRRRHDEIVAAFRRAPGQGTSAVLGVTTQVCELSLDLDCDLLVTEDAPVSALIQRFGRCCRDQDAHETGRAGRVLVYEPESASPYQKDEMSNVPAFIRDIDGRVVSQSGLEELLSSLGGAGYPRKDARFITDGPWAAAGQDHFRDAEDQTCQALLPGDLDAYRVLAGSRARWRAQELIVPILREARDDSHRPPGMPSWLTLADVKRHEYLEALGYVAKSGGGYATA
jgi:CRISPR-associated endonuclease/helicase Cas3